MTDQGSGDCRQSRLAWRQWVAALDISVPDANIPAKQDNVEALT